MLPPVMHLCNALYVYDCETYLHPYVTCVVQDRMLISCVVMAASLISGVTATRVESIHFKSSNVPKLFPCSPEKTMGCLSFAVHAYTTCIVSVYMHQFWSSHVLYKIGCSYLVYSWQLHSSLVSTATRVESMYGNSRRIYQW